jgi:hypothetical protein
MYWQKVPMSLGVPLRSDDLLLTAPFQCAGGQGEPGATSHLRPRSAQENVDTRKEVRDVDHFKAFANEDVAGEWFAEHDPEGVAFEYRVIGAD